MADLAAFAERLGRGKLARELGLKPESVDAVLRGTARRGTLAIVKATLPRLRTELAAWDAARRDRGDS
jgi:hypothetical protein